MNLVTTRADRPPIAPDASWSLLIIAATAGLGAMAVISPLPLFVLLLAPIAVLLIARPDLAAPVTLGLVYSNAAVVAAQFHGLPYFVAAAVPALLALPIAYRLLVRRESVVVTAAAPLLLVYLFVQLLAALAARDTADSMREVFLYASQGVVLYLLLTNALRTPALLRVAIWVVLLVGAGLALLPVIQQLTDNYGNNFAGFAQSAAGGLLFESAQAAGVDDRQPRAAGPIGEQNFFAQLLIVLVPLGLMRFWTESQPLLRWLALGATGIITLGVMLTFSRGAALGFIALVGALFFLRYLTARHLLLMAAGAVALALLLPGYVERIASLEELTGATAVPGTTETDEVLQQRTNDVLAAVLVYVENPLLGVGPGRFADVYVEYGPRVGGLAVNQDFAAHSLFPEVGAESGTLGLIVFSGILWVTMRDLLRARSLLAERRPELAAMATGFMLSLIVYLATSVALHLSYQRYFWTLMALCGAAGYVALREAARLEAEAGGSGRAAARVSA